MADLVSGAVAA